MNKFYRRASRSSLITSLTTISLTVALVACCFVSANAQQPDPSKVRRPLPKPSSSSRGFEQYPNAANRLISAGASRDIDKPLIPSAPYLGIAYDAHPFFKWSPNFSAKSYDFTVYEGDINEKPAARVFYQTEVKDSEFVYPTAAPRLIPGTLYSWRVAAHGNNKDKGPAVSFYVLMEQDAKDLQKALLKVNPTAPKTPEPLATQLRRADVFAEYGVWYDALHIANNLMTANPENDELGKYYDQLIDKITPKQKAQKSN